MTRDGTGRNVALVIEAFFPIPKDLELAVSFIHPLIQALLSYENGDKVAICTDTLPDNSTGVSRRPNYEIMIYDQYQPSYRTCFGDHPMHC